MAAAPSTSGTARQRGMRVSTRRKASARKPIRSGGIERGAEVVCWAVLEEGSGRSRGCVSLGIRSPPAPRIVHQYANNLRRQPVADHHELRDWVVDQVVERRFIVAEVRHTRLNRGQWLIPDFQRPTASLPKKRSKKVGMHPGTKEPSAIFWGIGRGVPCRRIAHTSVTTICLPRFSCLATRQRMSHSAVSWLFVSAQ
jgi:hypothetical protein